MRFHFGVGLSAVVASLIVVGCGVAEGPVQSAHEADPYVGPFEVEDITGPNQGKSLCYR